MADSQNQLQNMNGDASSSDNDSVSLLCHLPAYNSTLPAEDMDIHDLDSQTDNQVQKEEMEAETHQQNAPPSAAEIQPCVKIPSKNNLHRKNEWGETYLHKACKRKDLARVKALIQAGISIDMKDHAGWTALHEASSSGVKAVVEELLKAGADVNVRSFDGVTPLHDAVSAGHYEVAKLLLQFGSDPSNTTAGGLNARDMAQEEDMKELLFNSQAHNVLHEHDALAASRQAGDTSSEIHCHMQLPCQSSVSSSPDDKADVESRESGDGDGAREPGDIQRKKDNRRHSEAVMMALEEVRRKQKSVSTWPLAGPEDAGTFGAALAQIQDVLIKVLNIQQLEKDRLAHTCRKASNCLVRRLLRSPLASLASCQSTLVEILQQQMHMEELYLAMKTRYSLHSPNNPRSTEATRQPDRLDAPASVPASPEAAKRNSCSQNSQRKTSQILVGRTNQFRSAPEISSRDFEVARHPAPSSAKRKIRINALDQKASSSQGCTEPAENTSQHIGFESKRKKVLVQTSTGDKGRHLSTLIQRGVLSPGSSLQLLLKGQWHLAHVLGDGALRDCKSKLHKTPERWLESILGNNIPVSSTYAWDKVLFRDQPLAYHLLNTEAEADTTESRPADEAPRSKAGSVPEEPLPDAGSLNHLMKVKLIHLVNEEDFLPNVVLDHHWEKLQESDDWGRS
ncbi:ankyrin repeat domain-containing protein 31-like [Antennarius striatus]|uniref:ankyrin repeat domain-containing protein 31-like n=1 Tax=Antennarius striatus TaxID=241820 RepID=UPI0035B1892B